MGGGGGFLGDVFDAISDAISDVGHFISDVGEVIGDVLNVAMDFKSILKDSMKVVTLVIAVVISVVTENPYPLIAWYAVNSGAVTQAVVSMSKQGWINESHVAVVATVANLAVSYYGFTAGGNTGAYATYAYNALTSIGVSSETALVIAQFVADAQALSYGYNLLDAYNIGSSLYGLYETYQQSMELEKSYKEAQAAFEVWWNNFKNRQSQEDNFIFSFVTGSYFKKLPGQPLFNINLPGREQYVCTDVQKPSYWIEQNIPYKEDTEIARLMWQNKNYDKAGGSNFMSIQTDYTMLK